MRMITRVLTGVAVAALALAGMVAGTGSAQADDHDFTVQKSDSPFWQLPVRPTASPGSAWYYCDSDFVADPSRFEIRPRPENEGGGWYPAQTPREVLSVFIWGRIEASVPEKVNMAGVTCGDVTFARFLEEGTSYPSINGLTYTFSQGLGMASGGGGAMLGTSTDGKTYVVHVSTQRTASSTPPPFEPETGDQIPEAIEDKGVVPFGTASIVVAVLDNDQLPNGASALEIIEGPANGEATVNTTSADWSITYVPRDGFTGQDRFTYLVTDSLGKTSSTNVTIDVLGEEVTPVVPEITVPEAPKILAPEAPVLEVPVVEVPVVVPELAEPTLVVDPVPFEAKTGAEDLSLTSVMGLGVRTFAVVLFLGGIGASVAAFLYRRRAVR